MRYLAFIFLLVPTVLWSSPAEEPETSNVKILDYAQDLFGTRANFMANNIDSFFANQRADDELGRSTLRVRSVYQMRERSLPSDDTQVRFNLRLPELQEKFHIRYVGMKGKEDPTFVDKKKKEDSNIIRIIDRPTADTPWLFRSDAGANVSLPPRVFARSRLRKSVQSGDFIHRFVEEVGWFSNEGFVQNTDFSTDYPLTDNFLLRFTNRQNWNLTDKTFGTGHGPALLHRVSDDEAFSYSLNMASTVDSGTWFVSNYTFSIDYRRNIYRQWMFLNITPGIDFPKEWSFRRTPFIALQLEVLFGYSKR